MCFYIGAIVKPTKFFFFLHVTNILLIRSNSGADLGFSRKEGADFQRGFENFDDIFFWWTELIF